MVTESAISEEILFDEEQAAEEIEPDKESEKRRIFTKSSEPTVSVLYDQYKDGDLVLQPEFQRYFVWDKTKSSRLIESLILDVPLPTIYLGEEDSGQESVIDGQQRLTSFFDFIDSKFALQGLEVRFALNGKTFGELDKQLQKKIRSASIRSITIQKESDKELKFEIFERLNTGSVALNDQELRNCVYRGRYNDLLKELAQEPDFMFLIGLAGPERRMRDVELVLRFAAFYHATYLKYKPPMRRFLNEDMRGFRQIEDKNAEELRKSFKSTTQLIRSLLARNAFKRHYRGTDMDPNGSWEPRKFNASLYDVLMYGFTIYDKNQIYPYLDRIREALIALMTDDQEFVDAIELSTSSIKMVTSRFDKWRSTLTAIVGFPHSESRCFSSALKDQLFNTNSTCSLCGQKIMDIDDAAVDHIDQYWMGGKTIPDNARLTHRFCNWSRPRNVDLSSASPNP